MSLQTLSLDELHACPMSMLSEQNSFNGKWEMGLVTAQNFMKLNQHVHSDIQAA